MKFTNYHSHSHFCDGKGSLEDQVRAAWEWGAVSWGFSSHAPLPFDKAWCMKEADLPEYLGQIDRLRSRYQDQMELYRGLEVDYIPGQIGPGAFEASLDYTIGSIHFVDTFPDGTPFEVDGAHEGFLKGLLEVFHGDPYALIARYFELTRQMLREDPPTILGHLDKIKIQQEEGALFQEAEPRYREAIFHTLEELAGTGVILEVNTRGVYKKKSQEPYPGREALAYAVGKKIPITLNADSHRPEEVNGAYVSTYEWLLSIPVPEIFVCTKGVWEPVGYSRSGLDPA